MASNAAIAKQLLGRKPPPGEHSLLVLGLAGLSASAGVVHLSVVADHLREGIAFGLFFVALGAFQLGWALAALLRRRRHLYWVAAAVNTAVILIWVLSRTIGIPAGVPEPVGRADLFSTLVEAILVTGSLALLRPIGEAVSRKIGRAVLVVSVAAAPLTGLVSTSIAGETHVHHEATAAHDHHQATAHDHHHAVPADHTVESGVSRDGVANSGHLAEHVVLGGA